MRRLCRILCNVLVVLSMLLCVATLALWIRSHRVADIVEWRGQHRYLGGAGGYDGAWAYATHGRLWVVTYALDDSPLDPLPEQPGWDYGQYVAFDPPGRQFWMPQAWGSFAKRWTFHYYDREWTAPGVWHGRAKYDMANDFSTVRVGVTSVSLAALAAAWAVMPLLAFLTRRAARLWNRPRHAGPCRQCGYDLRATPERCPECGAMPVE